MRFVLLTALAACSSLSAQTTTASLLGVVRDPSGAAIAGAQVTAENVQTSLARTAQSDQTGGYLLTNLPVGEYRLIVEASGFQKFVQNGITLVVDQNARVDAALAVGSSTQTVQVTAESTGVDTHSATVGELVDRARIQELPLNGRNAMTLAAVVPGVTNILSRLQSRRRAGRVQALQSPAAATRKTNFASMAPPGRTSPKTPPSIFRIRTRYRNFRS
jgi:hypothetical protein